MPPVLLRLVAGMALACAPVIAGAAPRYVGPAARGTGDGRSEQDASGDLTAAIGRALADPDVEELVLLPGRYLLDKPITLKPGGRPFTIRGRGQVVIDGHGVADTALLVNGRDLAIRGLTFRHFRQNGIVLIGSERITVDRNRFEDIASTAWSQAAIHGVHYLVGISVTGNVITDTGYAGILFEAGADGRLDSVVIRGNSLTHTCRTVADCGAIYAQGRAGGSGGMVIAGNTIHNFGPPSAQAQAIYLDDWLSDTAVSDNVISGTGAFAFQIHGGSRNRITGNTVDACAASGVLFYQEAGRAMSGNVVSGNTLRVPGARWRKATKLDIGRQDAIDLTSNRISGCSSSSPARVAG